MEQERLLNLALNKISGSWDEQLLARLLADLQASTELDLSLPASARTKSATCSGAWRPGRRPSVRRAST
jgi:hypothetical protein